VTPHPHPIAKVFAPTIFFALVLLSLGFSFGSAQAQGPASPMAAPRIENFELDPPERLAPGEALIFRLSGSPRGDASVTIDGVSSRIPLFEIMTGIYEGAYTITDGDRIDLDSVVTGNLRLGKQESSTILHQPLVEKSPVATTP
jgi:hypothetical protein